MSSVKVEKVAGEWAETLLSRQNKEVYPDVFLHYGPDGTFLPPHFHQHVPQIDALQVNDDDLWVCSFIKAGTTWTKEMGWLLQNNLNFEAAMCNSYTRVPYLEFDATWGIAKVSGLLLGAEDPAAEVPTSMDFAAMIPRPKTIQSHLHWSLLPKQIREGTRNPKIIYVARNPKDVCVSYFHHRVLIEGYEGSLDQHVEEFVADLTIYAPYWNHVKAFWERRHEPNVLFITFEELKKDLRGVVDKTAAFLGKTLSPAEKEQLLHHLSFDQMKANPHVNMDEITAFLTTKHGHPRKTHFMRKGQVGSWKEELSPAAIDKLNAWIRRNRIPGLWDDILS